MLDQLTVSSRQTALAAACLAAVGLAPCTGAHAGGMTIYDFNQSTQGGTAQSPLLPGPGGRLYGVLSTGGGPQQSSGALFDLLPPKHSGGVWSARTLYTFVYGGCGTLPGCTPGMPLGALAADANGTLYGVTQFGDGGGSYNAGIVYSYVPGSGAITVLHPFMFRNGVNDGGIPLAGPIFGADGALYGTTGYGPNYPGAPCGGQGCGIVYRLAPPTGGQTGWTETILHAFKGGVDGSAPEGELLQDSHGNLYGTCITDDAVAGNGNGNVFELSPPKPGQAAWTEKILYNFKGGADGANPNGKLYMNASGALYGVTRNGGAGAANPNHGTAYMLVPPRHGATAWTESVIYAFGTTSTDANTPYAGFVAGPNGSLLGTSFNGGVVNYGDGVVYQLSPPKAGHTSWTYKSVYEPTLATDGGHFAAALVRGAPGIFYTTNYNGGTGGGNQGQAGGTAVEVTLP